MPRSRLCRAEPPETSVYDAQAAELRAASCERVFVDHGASSRVADRPQWVACLDYLRPRAPTSSKTRSRCVWKPAEGTITALTDIRIFSVTITADTSDVPDPTQMEQFGITGYFTDPGWAPLEASACGWIRSLPPSTEAREQ